MTNYPAVSFARASVAPVSPERRGFLIPLDPADGSIRPVRPEELDGPDGVCTEAANYVEVYQDPTGSDYDGKPVWTAVSVGGYDTIRATADSPGVALRYLRKLLDGFDEAVFAEKENPTAGL